MAYSRTLNHFTSMQELATIWASSTSYVVNQLVIESDKLYRCLVAHTSGGTFIADLQAAYWVEISASEAGVFNYIGNPDAEVDASGWTTYAESDSVTFTDAGDLVTLNNHGLSNGNEISFTSITSTTGISVNTRYFVVSATTNTFQVASSSGGSALPLTTNGSGTMVRFVPKTGSGGSPNITWSRSIVSPLRGDADFNLVKDAANRQGQGVEYDFTIDNADLAKVLTVTFDYEVVSGTFATGDVTVYLIQDPSGTPLVIQPAGYQVQGATVGTKMRQIATFQTSSTVTSYRLCLHVSSVSATAYTLAVDNVVVGPQVVQYGAPVTDWQSYTPTFTGFGTVATQTFWWRRVGDSVEIKGRFVSGTVTATEARVSLPSLTSAASDKIATIELAGTAEINATGTIGQNVGVSYAVLAEQSVGYVTFSARSNGPTTGLTKLNANVVCGTGSTLSLEAKVPILGWSSTVQMSNDTDTRVVAASYRGVSSSSLTASNAISWTTRVFDTHGAMSGTTYTVQVPGIYRVSIGGFYTTALCDWGVWVNSSATNQYLSTSSSTLRSSNSSTVSCVAGDTITIRPTATTTLLDTTNVYLYIERLSGPSAIAASETVAVKARTNAGQALTVTPSAVAFADIEYSTHGSFSGSTFTAPISGKYRVTTLVTLSIVTLSISQSLEVLLYKNGTLYNNFNTLYGNGGGANYRTGGSTTVSLLAGETVQIFALTTIATTIYSGPSNAGWPFTYVCIERIGN